MDVNLNIEEKEIDFIKEELKGKVNPVDLLDIANRLALFKTRDNRSHRVKIYNPNCEYKIGDLIYKEYPGNIPIGSKKFIEIKEGVVLKVVDVRTRYGINEIKLKYEGTSEFKKYTSYLDRQKIELLLPHKQAKPAEKAEFLPEDNDPRRQLEPLEKRDFSALSKKLAGLLHKDPEIALISNKVLLKENLKQLDNSVFDRIKEFLKESKTSETTEFLVENFLKIRPDDENFDAYCFALNYKMQIDYKIDFQQTQRIGWGKWNLISVIYYLRKNSPISDENPLAYRAEIINKKNLAQKRKKFEDSLFPEGNSNTRYYLTQREISAGAVRLRPGFYDIDDSIEIELVDTKQKKSYVVYYYKDAHLMLGFKEIFERYQAIHGAILSFEMYDEEGKPTNGPGKLNFNLRTTKKGTIADVIEYNKEDKIFHLTGEKIASPIFVNKSMFLESSVFKTLSEHLDEFKKIDTLNKLIHKVFLEFGVKERNYEIHFLRLFHILDLIYPMDIQLIEDVILGNEEFIPEEKVPGVFYLDSSAVTGIEQEEVKRIEIQIDEVKKKREELRQKKIDQERKIKEDIRKLREERRKKREKEMWEKERLRREMEEKKAEELSQKKAAQSHVITIPTHTQTPVSKPKIDPAYPIPPVEEKTRKKEAAQTWDKKKVEADIEKMAKTPTKKSERKPVNNDELSEDEIKRDIELENLKARMQEPKKSAKDTDDTKKKVAYKDDGGFSGILASKLDIIVSKKDEDSKNTKK